MQALSRVQPALCRALNKAYVAPTQCKAHEFMRSQSNGARMHSGAYDMDVRNHHDLHALPSKDTRPTSFVAMLAHLRLRSQSLVSRILRQTTVTCHRKRLCPMRVSTQSTDTTDFAIWGSRNIDSRSRPRHDIVDRRRRIAIPR
jgi:hypothetical protein